jgi:serine/threonine protein kinase
MINLERILYDTTSPKKEVSICFHLGHPHVVKLIDHFQTKTDYCIVMELVNGGDLRNLINQRRQNDQHFSEETILRFFSQIISAMKYIHDHKIIHRDLKPENFFWRTI